MRRGPALEAGADRTGCEAAEGLGRTAEGRGPAVEGLGAAELGRGRAPPVPDAGRRMGVSDGLPGCPARRASGS